jgi:hypothetical protein
MGLKADGTAPSSREWSRLGDEQLHASDHGMVDSIVQGAAPCYPRQ